MFFRENRTRRDQNRYKFSGQNPTLFYSMPDFYCLRMVIIRTDISCSSVVHMRGMRVVVCFSRRRRVASDMSMHQRGVSL